MAAELSPKELLLLGRCPFFRGAGEALLCWVLALPDVSAEDFRAGEPVYQPHQFRRCLGVLLSGQVQVTNASLSVSVLEAGELFGAAALYNDLPDYATTLTARTPCRILFLPQGDVDRLLGEEDLRRLIALKRADNLAQAPAYWDRQRELDKAEAILDSLLAENACMSLGQLAVNGRDLLELGLSGPEVGAMLERLLDAVLEGELPNSRDSLLDAAKAWR